MKKKVYIKPNCFKKKLKSIEKRLQKGTNISKMKQEKQKYRVGSKK